MQLTPGQRILIDDGLPAACIINPEDRRACWKGRRLTKPRDLRSPTKDEEPATKMLRKEMAAAEQRKKVERFARLNELKAQKKDQAMKTGAKTKTKISKVDQVAGLRQRRAATKGPKPATGKKTAGAKARTPAKAKPVGTPTKAIRSGSKLEIVVGLLTRKEGCTTAEILARCNWSAVSVPQQARSAGLTLRQEKDGKVTRYWGS